MAKIERNYQWALKMSMGELFTLRKALAGNEELTEYEDYTLDNILTNINQTLLANNIVERKVFDNKETVK